MGTPLHTQDEHCTLDPSGAECTVCGVSFGDPCAFCGQRGFHRPDCASPDMVAEREHDARLAAKPSYCPRCGRHHERTGEAEDRCREGMRFAHADHRRRGGTA